MTDDAAFRDCVLCREPGGRLLWSDSFCRVVLPDEPEYPGFTRVILGRHVAEMTDLVPAERERLMRVVFAAETAIRQLLQPHKVNLASLGNVVPHLHWHVIPRFRDDPTFPGAVWAPRARVAAARRCDSEALARLLAALVN